MTATGLLVPAFLSVIVPVAVVVTSEMLSPEIVLTRLAPLALTATVVVPL